MSQLDDLLARSRSPSDLVERRRFTLSRDKAIEKQREFTLRHPRQYVLELVQAAVFAGATYIAIDTLPHTLLVAWVGGRALTARELENLLDYLFADRGNPTTRHLTQLAVGVNAILQRRPRTLRIESGDGSKAIRMNLDAKGNGEVGTPSDPIGGTYLYAEYGGGWFARFSGSSFTAEQGLVEERCLYTPVPILLNGSAPFGYRGSRHIEIFGARHQEHFDQDGRRGVVAVHSSPRAPTGFRVVVGGVWVTTLPLEALGDRPLVGVVCDDRLRKTADHSDIVRDHRYTELLHATQPVVTRLLQRITSGPYRPPPLPPLPVVQQRAEPGQPVEIAFEPLPQSLPEVRPRAATTLSALRDRRGLPLFYVEPGNESALGGRSAEPDRFPWQILVLSEGQAATLATELPDASLHRLTTKSDLDFVRRVVDHQVRLREIEVKGQGWSLRLRLHLEGRLPDWGHGRAGVPFCVYDRTGTVEYGVISDQQLLVSGGRRDELAARTLRTRCVMPRVSILVEAVSELTLSDHHVVLALRHAWKLAVPEHGEPHRELLCALLGALAVPRLQNTAGQVQVAASLPVGWPDSLRHVPLVDTDAGPLSLEDFLGLIGQASVRQVQRIESLGHMNALEARFGYGHLTHRELEGTPLFGVGRIGSRWVWLDDPPKWSIPAITQIIWVGATFRPRAHDDQWRTEAHPYPELVSAHRADVDPEDWEAGWDALLNQLERVDSLRLWPRFAQGAITASRAEGMGRIALLHLVILLDREAQPLLLPTDNGARRSLAELRSNPAARVVARHGVEVAEPWTFVVTRDELTIIEGKGTVPLRYDDPPEVWRALQQQAESGWLLRQEVRQSGLAGCLGLRLPYDGTSGILVRTTGRLVALTDLDRRVPCHGLLWPEDGSAELAREQERLVQLAGLRLYQELIGVLRDRSDPERTEAARRYAFGFVWLAHRRSGQVQGTAAELARLVELYDEAGDRWGSLERWLAAPADDRTPAPIELPLDDVRELPAIVPVEGDHAGALTTRLTDALGHRPYVVTLIPLDPDSSREWSGGGSPTWVDANRSHRGRAVVLLDSTHALVKSAIARPGRPREILLLELARRVHDWAASVGLPCDLLKVQQVLLAQRLEGS